MTDLPPELKAQQAMMDMVFEALEKPKDVHVSEPRSSQGNLPEVCPVCGGRASACKVLGHRPLGDKTDWQNAAPQTSKRQIDIEKAIMTSPMDYLTASEIFAALQRRLEQRYDNLNPQVEEAMQKLSKAFDQAT